MNPSFWAKTTDDEQPGISVLEHMRNVGFVAKVLAEQSGNLLERFCQNSNNIAALAAIHDIGKISPGFQRKCETWLKENNLFEKDRNGCWDTRMESDHGKVSHAAIQKFLSSLDVDYRTAKYVSAVLGGHHGRLNLPNDRGFRPQGMMAEGSSGIEWDKERTDTAQSIWKLFNGSNNIGIVDEMSPFLWWLAGLTSVADWIGSDERFFPVDKTDSTEDVFKIADSALSTIGFQHLNIIEGLSFHDLFHDPLKPDVIWTPNELQEKTASTITSPGVYVVEAPMGMGKTEAALWAGYQLISQLKANGIYFALPTQATSNRIHFRMGEFIRRIAPSSSASRLIHSNSWLMDKTVGIQPSSTGNIHPDHDARNGRDWFASAKRALLAPFGVGTIDQALLGVVAAKHFFVRHFALAGKVVILDEVHSYDLYTGTLIDKLISTLENLGCTVIVLSATLTTKRRAQIISGFDKEINGDSPLIVGRKENYSIESVSASSPAGQDIQVSFTSVNTAAADAIELAENGGCVLWICNTVDQAQTQYLELKNLAGDKFNIGLLHSRFPFWRREEIENEWMDRLGKSSKHRCGSILVSTQIVEQSVDFDADLMISELAPTDMLLQRLGRLWRHKRADRCIHVGSPRILIIEERAGLDELREMKPKEIIEVLGNKAHVYHPYVLLRTLQEWKVYDGQLITIPGKIRELLECTYEERTDDPVKWEKVCDEKFIKDSNERFMATFNSNYWQPQLPDEEGVQTRLIDIPTVSLVLCRELSAEGAGFVDSTRCEFIDEEFRLKTGQVIHKNIVKVPMYCFDKITPFLPFSMYLHGSQCAGIVAENNHVEVNGLKDGFALHYTDEMGLIIEKPSGKECI